MSDPQNENPNENPDGTPAEQGEQPEGGYSATDLPEGATPDPLGDASLTPQERAGATGDGDQ